MAGQRLLWLFLTVGLVIGVGGVGRASAKDLQQPLSQGTSVCGAISTDTTWSADHSPYVATCNITVNDGVTLTIEPGVEVRFGGEAAGQQLVVAGGGRLVAEGTPDTPIHFTSGNASPQPGDWTNLLISDHGSASLAHCTVGYAGRFGFFSALQVSGDVAVRHCRLHDNLGDAIQLFGTDLSSVIEHTQFENNGKIAVNQMVPDASATYRQLVATGNGTDAVIIAGGFIQGIRSWNLAQADIPVIVNGSITVATGGALFLESGSRVEFDGSLTRLSVNGALYALGSANRAIVVTGRSPVSGSWAGITIGATGRATLEHCEISYAAGISIASNQTVMQSCDIHHSSVLGIQVDNNARPLLVNNSIRDNPLGLNNTSNSVVVDARRNWWGHASGPYHPETNPNGLGNSVSDRVLYTDWLTQQPITAPPVSDLSIDISGPQVVNPGGSAEFKLSYQYVGEVALEDVVMVAVLPATADYEDGGADGIYWPGRREIFWKLGTLSPPLATGERLFRVRYWWGLNESRTPALALIGAANWPNDSLNVAPYLAYTPTPPMATTALSQQQVTTLLNTHPDLHTFYQAALARGFTFIGAFNTSYANGRAVAELVLINAPSSAIFLQVEAERVTAIEMAPEMGIVRQGEGGVRVSFDNATIETFGDWSTAARATLQPQEGFGQCVRNCLNEEFGFTYWMSSASRSVTTVLSGVQCLQCIETGDCAQCAMDVLSKKGVGEINSLYKCFGECGDDPDKYRCQEGQVIRTCRSPSNWSWTGINDQCGHLEYSCDPSSGQWLGPPTHHTFWGSGYTCIEGQGCVNCPSGDCSDAPIDDNFFLTWRIATPDSISGLQCVAPRTTAVEVQPRTCDSNCPVVRTGKDPNAKLGPVGDLLPGQIVTYTITYENEGAGRAFGVFIVDRLSEYLDGRTVEIQGNGLYVPQSHTVIWDIGELAPKGEPDAAGMVSFTARLRDDLPSGTTLVNQATVHFPSVPEVTPTNLVVNQIYPLVAQSMEIETDANKPANILLQGRDAADSPLTFQIEGQPQYGALTGVPPQIIYTPAKDFNGQDRFAYTVSNGVSRSQAAEVMVYVRPASSDTTPPRVVWALPEADGVLDNVGAIPLVNLDTLKLYAPGIRIRFSEALEPSTVNTSTVRMATTVEQPVSLYVEYLGIDNMVVAYPLQPLQPDTGYRVTLAPEITDLVGNRLAALMTWRFRLGGLTEQSIYLPLIHR